MSCDPEQLAQLKALADTGKRAAYYRCVEGFGDPYGVMAGGVVSQSTLSGVVARCYAIEVSKRYCRIIDDAMWVSISTDLMTADLAARRGGVNFDETGRSLRWNVIRDYHVAVFGTYGLPPETWTAWIPLQIAGEAKDAGLWHRMVTETFLPVALETVWLVVRPIAFREGADRTLALHGMPTLREAPPVAVGGGADPQLAACMKQLAPYQLAGSDSTDKQKLAIFYLAVLAQSPALPVSMALAAPGSAWRALPPLVSPAY